MTRKAIWARALPILCLLAPVAVLTPAQAAPAGGQLAIGSPLPNTLIAGRVSLSLAYDTGQNRITSFTILVDDQIHSSREFLGTANRGIQYLEFDTRALPDGNHTVKIVARGTRGILALDQVNVTIRNGVAGGADLVPPLVQFRNLTDGQTVSGKITLDLLAEDNSTTDLLVSIFVNQFPRLIKSRPPYHLELNTSEFLDPATGTGSVKLEAWAYDRFNNLGKARPITLQVQTPGPSENQTRAPGVLSRPMPMEGVIGAEPQPMPGVGDQIIPLPGLRGDMPMKVEPRLPQSANAEAGGRPVITRNAIQPGARPTQPRAARAAYSAVDPEFAPIGSAGRGALSGGKSALPYIPPRSSAGGTPARPVAAGPAFAPGTLTPGRPSGLRASTPAGRPAPAARPVLVAKATPIEAPAIAASPRPAMAAAPPRATHLAPVPAVKPIAAAPRPAAPAPRASSPAPLRVAKVTPVLTPDEGGMPEGGATLPMPGAQPRLSQDGPRTMPPADRTTPKPAAAPERVFAPRPPMAAGSAPVQMARAPKAEPIFVVVDPKGRPGRDGKVKADVFRLNMGRMPQDRDYRVRSGDTLDAIAKKHGVTTKSLLVANALTAPRSLRTGSVIKVPGTYDIVMNDRRLAFDVAPRIENGLALTPFRQIFEHAGGVVVWNPETQEVRAANPDKDVKLRIGSKEARVNQVIVVMDREAFLDSGRTIVPLTFMEKALDLKAEYDVRNGTVMLVKR